MRYYKSVPNSNQVLAALMQKGPEVAHVLEMLQLACWNNWRDILCNQLCATVVRWPPAVAHSGAGDPTNPTPAEWAKFRDYVIWAVKQRGIADPEAWLDDRAKLDAKVAASAPADVGPPAEIGDLTAQRKSAAREPVALENRPATTSAALPPRPAARTVEYGTTEPRC